MAMTTTHNISTLNQCSLMFTKFLFKDKSWLQKHSAQLENVIRKMVREEVDHAIQRSPLFIPRSLPSQTGPSVYRQYKLHFEGKLPLTLFTGNKVEAEGPAPVRILWLDAVSGHPVKHGPLLSKKVEIVVLQGHFKAEQSEEWTKKDFCDYMVSKRDNKGSLLVGKCVITLNSGIGFVDDICFTDNSSWVRSKMFRLGARVLAEEDQVREAVTSPFQVKDRRGEIYQKHNIPSLDDEVWRLCHIAKDGRICQRLEQNQIRTVKDFITLYHSDESLLCSIVKTSPKKWKEIIQHAKSCDSANACTNPNNLAQTSIPIGCTSNTMTIPCSNLQQFDVNVQQENLMLESHAGEHNLQLADQSMALGDSLLENLLIGSSNDVYLPSLGYSLPSSSATMLNLQTSSWVPDLMGDEDIGMLSSVPFASDNGSKKSNTETVRMASLASFHLWKTLKSLDATFFQYMFDFEISSWFPVSQSMEDGYSFCMGASCICNVGRLVSPIPNVSVHASEVSKPKEGWGKL